MRETRVTCNSSNEVTVKFCNDFTKKIENNCASPIKAVFKIRSVDLIQIKSMSTDPGERMVKNTIESLIGSIHLRIKIVRKYPIKNWGESESWIKGNA